MVYSAVKTYKDNILRNLFHKDVDAESGHDSILCSMGEETVSLGGVKFNETYTPDKRLECTLPGGIKVDTPIGNAAGFDKRIEPLDSTYQRCGFGYRVLGSITYAPRAGNPRTREFMLFDEKSFINSRGLDNYGAERTLSKMKSMEKRIPWLTSIAGESVEDYVNTTKILAPYSDAVVINISCPNTEKGCAVKDDFDLMNEMFDGINKVRGNSVMYVKASHEPDAQHVKKLSDLFLDKGVSAVVAINSTSRPEPRFIRGIGGLGGKVMDSETDETIKNFYEQSDGQMGIIGCGGVFTGEDAVKKFELGATAIKVATALFFNGPYAAAEINEGILAEMDKRGHSKLSDFYRK